MLHNLRILQAAHLQSSLSSLASMTSPLQWLCEQCWDVSTWPAAPSDAAHSPGLPAPTQ